MPISCESQYIIDSLNELLGITTDTYEYIWNHQLDIDGLVDDNRDIKQVVNSFYDAAYDGLGKEEKASLALEVLLGSDRQLDEYFKHLAGKVVDAFYKGTDRPFPAPHGWLHQDDTKITDPNDLIQILTVLETIDSFAEYRNLFTKAFNRSIQALQGLDVNAYIRYKRDEIRRLQLAREGLTLDSYLTKTDPDHLKRRLAVRRKQENIGKKVLKKSIRVLDSFMGQTTSQAFIHGNKVEIIGEKFKFIIQKGEVKLLAHSADPTSYHVPFRLTVTDKHDVLLGQVCLLFRDTPILDQILAVHLHVMGGKEEELIKTANWFKMTEAYNSNPDIIRIRGPKKKLPESYQEVSRNRMFDNAGIDEYFALRDQVCENLIQQYSEQLIGLSRDTVNFLMNPPVHKHELLDRPETFQLLQVQLDNPL